MAARGRKPFAVAAKLRNPTGSRALRCNPGATRLHGVVFRYQNAGCDHRGAVWARECANAPGACGDEASR